MIPPHNSLVRYDNPALVSNAKHHAGTRGASKYAAGGGDSGAGGGEKGASPTEDILNSILPPREWTEDSQLWVQYVSSTPATASDVAALQEALDGKLQQRQARETGICPVREELYAQCFDELIRQVTINCAERGLLLLRVRDEIRMTIAAYQTLYESSIAFGMRKALMADQEKAAMEAELQRLEGEVLDLENQVEQTKDKVKGVHQGFEEKSTAEGARHAEEIDLLKEHNESLRADLEAALSVPTSA